LSQTYPITFEDFSKEIGQSLRETQERSGIPIEQLAKLSGLSRFTVMKIFAGKPPTLRSLFVLCQAMNCRPGICIVGVCTEN